MDNSTKLRYEARLAEYDQQVRHYAELEVSYKNAIKYIRKDLEEAEIMAQNISQGKFDGYILPSHKQQWVGRKKEFAHFAKRFGEAQTHFLTLIRGYPIPKEVIDEDTRNNDSKGRE